MDTLINVDLIKRKLQCFFGGHKAGVTKVHYNALGEATYATKRCSRCSKVHSMNVQELAPYLQSLNGHR